MSYTVSPAFKGLSCLICGQQAHGNRFGAVCCLPCAAFFRRYVVEKCKYKCINGNKCSSLGFDSLKKCKACRYRQCRSVGMQITTIDHNTVEKETFLEKFVAAYENYINAQQQIFFNLYPERLNEKLPFFIPENLQCIHYFEQNCVPAMLEMLNSSIYEFEELEVLEKNDLIDACFDQFNFLNCIILTMRTYPLECYYSVNNFVLAYGHIFDFGIKEKIINHWAKDSQNAEEKLMNEINELIYLIRRFLGFSDYKIKIEDCCALMAITLCNKFSSINSSIGELIWERLRENILNEWFQHISSSTGSDKCASNQLVLLTSALLDLESYCQAIKNRKDDYSGTVVEINNFTNIESKLKIILPNLLRILRAHNRIWGAFYELPDSYIRKFSNFNQMLSSSDNILGYYEKFNPNPPIMKDPERQAFYTSLNRINSPTDHPHISKSITVCRLLVIGIFKALPFFQRLSRNDQVILINKQIKVINILLKSFNAVRMKAKTLYGTDGLTTMEILCAQSKFRENKQLMHLGEKAFSKVVEPFLKMSPVIDDDEFSILIAILCSSGFSSSDLSTHARILLQTESEFYAKMLLKHCQLRFGDARGASRYAECMHLIECSYIFNRHNELFVTYMEAFYLQRTNNQIPKYLLKVV